MNLVHCYGNSLYEIELVSLWISEYNVLAPASIISARIWLLLGDLYPFLPFVAYS